MAIHLPIACYTYFIFVGRQGGKTLAVVNVQPPPTPFFLRIVWNFERQATNRSSARFQCRICEHQTSDQGNFGSHFLNGKCAVYANFLKCCCEEYKIKAQIIPRRHCTPPSAVHESSHVSFEEMNERKSVQRKNWSKLCRTEQWYCSTFDQFVYLRFFRFETLRHMWHF